MGMLCLKRRKNEEVVITTASGRIRLVVLECSSQWVRIGCEAPENVPVFRGEIQRKIDGEAKQ